MVYTNPYIAKDRELERKLARLERMYDGDSEHHRKYHDALNDIQLLFDEKKIDREHARYLAESAEAVYNAARAKINDKRKSEAAAAKEASVAPVVAIFLTMLALFVIFLVVAL